MANIDADLEDQQSKGVFATLMADGKWMYQAGEYKKAIDSFTEVSVVVTFSLIFFKHSRNGSLLVFV